VDPKYPMVDHKKKIKKKKKKKKEVFKVVEQSFLKLLSLKKKTNQL
jgi:hypothetical protein